MSKYTAQELESQLKPLSENAFLRFWQKIWRWWLGVWYGFSDKHPKAAKIIYMVFFFIVFSEGVTIFQILVLIFLPMMFGIELAGTEFMVPKVFIPFDKIQPDGGYYWSFLGNNILYNEAGEVIIGGGLGYFLAFKIATFLAQCINFPLQRNITYRSHGNPWFQAMWYFIGWLLINPACDAINNLWIPPANVILPPAITAILAMVAQGGVAMVIFFFIFLIIFPDNAKVAQKAKAKYEQLKASGAEQAKIDAAYAKYVEASKKSSLTNAEKDAIAANSTFNSKVMNYQALVKASQNEKNTEEQKAEYETKLAAALEAACEAYDNKLAKEAYFEDVKAQGGVVIEETEEAAPVEA